MDAFFLHVLRAVDFAKGKDERIIADDLSRALGFERTRQSEPIRQRLTKTGVFSCRPGKGGGYFITAEADGADVRWLWLMVYGPYLPWGRCLADAWAGMSPAEVLKKIGNKT